ncbi:MAG: hypothetical protein KDC92_05760 [Bacteroidetes bacterium]|nr:hypothetical protein [Bacteroidota bacterium]
MMKQILTLLTVLLVFTACERDLNTEGPDLVDLYGDLAVLEELKVSQPSAKFADGETVYFTARFSKLVNWRLTITGTISGAQKIFENKSKVLDASNTTWAGEFSKLPFFKTEMCDVELVANDSIKFNTQFIIQSLVEPKGLVVADFENGMNPEWSTFVQSGANMSFNITDQGAASPQGEFFYDMAGEVNWDWLIGMIEFPGAAYSETESFPLPENPNDVYFNAMIYVPDSITNAVILFQFREDDNEDGTFTEANEDMYAIELKGNFESGWQVYSQKYADLVSIVNGAPAEPNGNKKLEPNKLNRISLLFLANPSSGYSKALLDYVIFTEGKPLIP